jgi:hypothetical protein
VLLLPLPLAPPVMLHLPPLLLRLMPLLLLLLLLLLVVVVVVVLLLLLHRCLPPLQRLCRRLPLSFGRQLRLEIATSRPSSLRLEDLQFRT